VKFYDLQDQMHQAGDFSVVPEKSGDGDPAAQTPSFRSRRRRGRASVHQLPDIDLGKLGKWHLKVMPTTSTSDVEGLDLGPGQAQNRERVVNKQLMDNLPGPRAEPPKWWNALNPFEKRSKPIPKPAVDAVTQSIKRAVEKQQTQAPMDFTKFQDALRVFIEADKDLNKDDRNSFAPPPNPVV